MSNPNNAIGTNGAYGGRTSVNAFNDVLGAFTSGILSGWVCAPNTGLTVVLGGSGTTRDVAIAEDNAGNKTTINNISGSPISVTIPAAPASNSRVDLIVAYVDNPPEGVSTTADNPDACGLIVVSGTAASTPTEPDDNAIRTAITADGASGATAYYAILAKITISSGTATITSSNIASGDKASLHNNNLPTIEAGNIDLGSLGLDYSTSEQDTGAKWIDGSAIYKKTIDFGTLPDNTDKIVAHGISNIAKIIDNRGYAYTSNSGLFIPIPFSTPNSSGCIAIVADATNIRVITGTDRTEFTECYITVYYTKTS